MNLILTSSMTIFYYFFLYFLSQTNGDVFKGHESDKGGKDNDFIQNVIIDLLSDPEAIKALIPKTHDELFGILDKIIPGMKGLQKPIEITLNNFGPVLHDCPDVLERLAPTLKEIIDAVVTDRTISDDEFIKFGKSLWDAGGQHLRNWAKATQASPLAELKQKIQKLQLAERVESFLEGDQLRAFRKFVEWMKRMEKQMADIAGLENNEIEDKVCSKEPGVKGKCKANFKRWTFMKNWGCFSFSWGGCGGNQNNFMTKKACEMRCTDETDSVANVGGRKTDRDEGGKDYDFIQDVIRDLLSDPKAIKDLIPKTHDELFGILDKIIPGMKGLQKPIEMTLNNFGPVLHDCPDVLEKLAPTFKEIISTVVKHKTVSDDEIIKFGKSILAEGGQHLRDWAKATHASPLSELLQKIKNMNLAERFEQILEGDQLETFREIVEWVKNMMKHLADIAGLEHNK